MMVAEPGSASQRNAERQGFRTAYAHTKWRLRSGGPGRSSHVLGTARSGRFPSASMNGMERMGSIDVHPVGEPDREWVQAFVAKRWHSSVVVSRGRVHDPARLPGFIARERGEPVGLVTYRTEDGECEVVTIDSLREGIGVGSALLEAVREEAASDDCRRLWLITTNDNLPALRFYQKRGFSLVAVHRVILHGHSRSCEAVLSASRATHSGTERAADLSPHARTPQPSEHGVGDATGMAPVVGEGELVLQTHPPHLSRRQTGR